MTIVYFVFITPSTAGHVNEIQSIYVPKTSQRSSDFKYQLVISRHHSRNNELRLCNTENEKQMRARIKSFGSNFPHFRTSTSGKEEKGERKRISEVS
ncbi:hypothetical protein TNCV_751771 [Trichonephila clavipes]|uniref:Uncharacterized protein n=1 Tax=Trichonephila clavipes TaxID=2585209 RepID=A0A8X6WB70_TRICX|nr:hypothetical protein TNCV_751771 [Trichonephila clavipes]